jgi:uncharacterized membrane protein
MAHKKSKIQAVTPNRLIASLSLLSLVSVGLLIARILDSSSYRYAFLIWNLALAIIPVFIAWWLVERIRIYGWQKWQQLALTFAWIAFLPNSFYLLTDLIHLRPNYEADFLFDATLLTSFILSGITYGLMSVYLVHRQLVRRVSERSAYGLVGLLFLAVSFAICLGRYTRWNTWDIILRPAGLLFDVSDRFLNPSAHVQTYLTTVTVFLVLFSTYIIFWEAVRFLRQK